MREGGDDVRRLGGIDLPTIQKYLNFWFSVSLDLFGGEVSTNAAQYFAAGLKGRAREESFSDHTALGSTYPMELLEEGELVKREVPLRNAMNEVMRDQYIEDCQRGVDRWNKVLSELGIGDRLSLPHRRFNRGVGSFAGARFNPAGERVSQDVWQAGVKDWLPSEADRLFVKNLMRPVCEPGKIANWIAPPSSGIRGKPFDFEYVRHNS
jgi:benzoyl-CoA 2,3-dioxygenase component B